MTQRLPPKDQLIMGLHALQELLRHAPSRLLRVYTSRGEGRGDARKEGVLQSCKKEGVPIEVVSESFLDKICGSDSHQSFAAHVKGRKYYSVKEFLKTVENEENCLVLMCDQIFDPQNFGALLRTAECLGVSGVVWSKNRGSDLTPVAAKASSGASEWIPLIRVSNLAESVREFQNHGFEAIASAFTSDAENAFSFQFPPKTVLILGSEGEGIQPLILKMADRKIMIPMQGRIHSLSVVQAAASFLTCYQIKQII